MSKAFGAKNSGVLMGKFRNQNSDINCRKFYFTDGNMAVQWNRRTDRTDEGGKYILAHV
jgi:hypothetical protein